EGATPRAPESGGAAGAPEGGAEARAPGMGPRPANFRTEPRFAEVRALWVVRTTLDHPDSVRAMVRRADEAGFNTLLVQVRGRGEAYYRTGLEPPPSTLLDTPSDYDPLALTLQEAHARGMAVHAWVNAHLVGGTDGLPQDPDHLINAHPDWLAVPRDLARQLHDANPAGPGYARALVRYAREHPGAVEGVYTSPAHPSVQEHLYAVWTELARWYELDGIHLDYIRYPGPEFDYSRVALDRFRAWVRPRLGARRRSRLERAYRTDPLAYADALPELWAEFRRAQITDLVRRSYFGIKRRDPDVLVTAAVRPDPVEARRERFQDWPSWLEEWIVDAAAIMSYVPEDPFFRHLVEKGVEIAGGDRIWAGIGIYRTTLAGAVSQIRIAREAGARGISLFSYDWAVSRSEANGSGEAYLLRLGREAFASGW
ncbi:MAG TPA: family 10 glycosylhydrolase, partial [Longimicrobiales bacterium]|nr:family 10 glycosylhydrolase [Longimicrobiales bacterium]